MYDVKQVKEINEKNSNLPITRYERDLLGNVTKITDALGNSESFAYDKKSQLIEKIDKEGYLTIYGYQANGEVEKIKYADGREVRLSYNALRQLEEVEDWLGITRIQSNPRGQATKVSYPDGKEVSYTYGKLGEKTQMVYPDGKEVNYAYDEFNRLAKVTDEVGATTYSYNEQGYLSKKSYPNEMESLYTYTSAGQLASLVHQDSQGIIDAYHYAYDIQGNKTIIEKERRGLPEDSGKYSYAYDELQRLTNVSKDGSLLRTYGYDAFGNRASSMEVNKNKSKYTYNAMNQLISRVDSAIDDKQGQLSGNIIKEERYTYDKRGNLTETYQGNNLINQYHFGALNRLEKAVNHQTKEVSEYMYNGLGHRVGKTIGAPIEISLPTVKLDELTINPTKKIEDTIDLTKQYHNLLQRAEDSNVTSFTWDSNVLRAIGVDSNTKTNDSKNYNQYLQDDLGSPIRFFSPNEDIGEIYGYDEFGQETTSNYQADIVQPFTYTGYQKDDVANTYYAQAREYKSKSGHFTSVDAHWDTENGIYGDAPQSITSSTFIPNSLAIRQANNLYGYTVNNPLKYIDSRGNDATLATEIFKYGWGICVELAASDGPLPVGDAVGLAIGVGATVIAGGALAGGHISNHGGEVVEQAVGSQLGVMGIVGSTAFPALRSWALEKIKTGAKKRDSGEYSVYIVWDGAASGNDSIWYVGITKDYKKRELAHKRNYEKFGPLLADEAARFRMSPITTGLTRDQARVLEQALMMAFGTIGILNKINSIAQRNWDAVKFAEEVQRLKTLFSSITCSD